VLDPFAGTGTALVVAEQLQRKSIGIEIDSDNIRCIKERLKKFSQSDNITKFYKEYIYTENLKELWHIDSTFSLAYSIPKKEALKLFNL